MAHKKGAGSTDNGRDSASQRLGVKLFGGQHAIPGNILVRQRGTRFHPGKNVYMGKDHTLHAAIEGVVMFKKSVKDRTFVHIVPGAASTWLPEVNETLDVPSNEVKPPVKTAGALPVSVPIEIAVPAEASASTQSVELKTPAAVEEPTVQQAPELSVESAIPVQEASEIEEFAVLPITKGEDKPSTAPVGGDNLKIIEGIGPKIELLLKEGGYMTWTDLANADAEKIKEILHLAGSRYSMHDPSTWPHQAKLAAEGKWDELEILQKALDGGKERHAE